MLNVRWHHRFSGDRRWPLGGYVAVIGAEAQDAVFLDVHLVSQLGPDVTCLRIVGVQRWLSTAEQSGPLKRELSALSDLASSESDRLAVRQAIELVNYEIASRTGVAVAPPKAAL